MPKHSSSLCRCTIGVRKGKHTYIFSFPPGREMGVLPCVLRYATDPHFNLSAVDVACFLKELTRLAARNRKGAPPTAPLWLDLDL